VKREAVERRARLPRQAQQMEQIAHDLEAVAAQLRAVEASQQVNGGSGAGSAQEKSQTNIEAF
jgi:histone acetyltransferase HPA2